MADRPDISNPLSRLTADPVLRAFFNRSAPPPTPAFVFGAPKPPSLIDGERKALPLEVEFA